MSIYLDAAILVALWTENDAHSARAAEFFKSNVEALSISDLAAAEFASVLARQVRTRSLSEAGARDTFRAFDTWRARTARAEAITSSDIASATAVLRRLDLNLRAADAIHIAAADRMGATLATFDKRMADCARRLGVAVIPA